MIKRAFILLGILFPMLGIGQSNFNQFKAQKHVIEGAKKLYSKSYEAALRDFEMAVSLDPYNKDVYQFRGEANYRLGRYDLALEDYDRALSIHDDVPELYYKRGLAHEQLGYYNQASRDYRYALTLNPQYSLAQRKLRNMDRRYDYDAEEEYYGDRYMPRSERDDRDYDDGDYDPRGYNDRGDPYVDPDNGDRYWWERDEEYERRSFLFEGENLYVQNSPEDVNITQIEVTPYVTRVTIQVVNQGRYTKRFYLEPPLSRKSMYITDREMEQKYHVTNIIRGKWGDTEIRPGGRATFVLEFERIPDDLEYFHLRTGESPAQSGLNFYGVILKK